ncbi:iron-containing alcohol dehydrogenase [bacterium]|nr:iron-containing alcohol dehydrogenase [bacterium]
MKHAGKRIWFNIAARALTILPQKVPTLLTGAGSLKLIPSELEVLGAKKPLVVTDAVLVKTGVVARVAEILNGAGIPYAVFDQILPDPTYEICAQGLAALRAGACDAVIAVGGGSVIDAAKLIRMGATHRKNLAKFVGLLPFRNGGLPFICVPSTAGTGSEATAAAVITDAARHRKQTILDPRLPPNTAILDPLITTGLPPAMTAATGMDALTHAVEAYTNTLHYSDVDVQAIEAVRLIFSNLRAACADGSKVEAREAMLRASHLAGRAFTRGFVGYVHAVAHRFGERYHVPHGLANAIALPYFLDLYREACPERLADLAAAAGLRDHTAAGDAASAAQAFVDAVRSLAADIGIPAKAAFLVADDIPAIAVAALKEAHGTPYPVPLVLDASALETVIRSMLA